MKAITNHGKHVETVNCQAQNVHRMIKGNRKSVNGWQLVNI